MLKMTKTDAYRRIRGLPEGAPVTSPWGSVQHAARVASNLWYVITAGHGGYRVGAALNREIPELFRNSSGWYEQDCEYAIVLTFLCRFFTGVDRDEPLKVLKYWYWSQFERWSGLEVSLQESSLKAEYLFKKQNQYNYLVISASGDWCPRVPKGYVGVTATLGGEQGGYYSDTFGEPVRQHDPEVKYFLVTLERYRECFKNPEGIYVIDPSIDHVWEKPDA